MQNATAINTAAAAATASVDALELNSFGELYSAAIIVYK